MATGTDWKTTAWVRTFGWWKIPLLALVRPRILEAGPERCVVRIPRFWLTRNHLGSLYFGALCIGADLAGGLMAMDLIRKRRSRVAFLFKDFRAEFLKRAEGATFFTCEDGLRLAELLERAESSGEREEAEVKVTATVPEKLGDEPVAEFRLTISLKRRG